MSIIAGALSRRPGGLPDGLREALIANLSRHPGDVVETLGNDRWLLAKVDVGALGCRASYRDSAGAAFVLAGEPLLSGAAYAGAADREAEGRFLFEDLASDRLGALKASAGTFCGAMYIAREHRLVLVADKLGVRPIYYLVTPEFAAFTSALRVFEAAGLNAGGIDERGTWEVCAFGFPLGTRTCYEGIRVIGAGEQVQIDRDAVKRLPYFAWDRLAGEEPDEPALLGRLVAAFATATRRRLRGDRTAISFLSGGLDSRAIVAMLRNEGRRVCTVNFAPPESQDRLFAAQAARALGANHHQIDVPLSAAGDFYRSEQLKEWIRSPAMLAAAPERPQCVWSGDGGSVGMGNVYMDDAAVGALERGDLAGGVRAFLRFNRLPGAANRALTPEFRERSRNWHVEGVSEEIAALDRKLDGRSLHLFLLLNDQRRHMARHFEAIDVNRLELLMPFFDGDFLEAIVRSPATPFMRHVLYHRWLESFSPAAMSVPWQTYPGHEPCPLPFDEGLRYQWGDYFGKTEDRRLSRKQARAALGRLLDPCFPRQLVARTHLASAIVLGLLGSGSLGHVVRVGDTFVRFWQQSHARKPPQFLSRSTTA